jgi:hypothetical protein
MEALASDDGTTCMENKIRKGLLNSTGNIQVSHYVITASNKMLPKLNGIFIMEGGTVMEEDNNRQEERHHAIGIPKFSLNSLSYHLDPRLQTG